MSNPAPPAPEQAVLAPAALAEQTDVSNYKPNTQDLALAGALFTSGARTLEDLAAASNIAPSTLLRIRQDPVRSAWITQRAVLAQRSRSAEVFAHLHRMATSSENPAWSKLWLERFDEDYKKQAAAAVTHATQNNFICNMSDRELAAFLAQTRQRVLGEKNA